MPKINLLPKEVAELIAAGEVVEWARSSRNGSYEDDG